LAYWCRISQSVPAEPAIGRSFIMMAQRRSIVPALLALATAAGVVWGAASIGWQARPSPSATRPTPTSAQPGICVTEHGLCGAAASTRTGDPCSCPHPLRGFVPGYVERLNVDAGPAHRMGRETEDDRDPWEKLEGVSP
jgi:hypothetical protein